MFKNSMESDLRANYAARTRSLNQAAKAAHEIAAAEHLPVEAALTDAERWHRETILKTVPVYGTRNRHTERVPAEAHLDGDYAVLDADQPSWSDLTVKGTDFKRYLEWLHSFQ